VSTWGGGTGAEYPPAILEQTNFNNMEFPKDTTAKPNKTNMLSAYRFSHWYDPADEMLSREDLINDKYRLMTGVDIWSRYAKRNFWLGLAIGLASGIGIRLLVDLWIGLL